MTVIESLQQYLAAAPPMKGKRLGIDCLASNVDSYSIDSVPCESIVVRYMDGATVRRCLFTLSSRMYYGDDLTQQAENLEFFGALETWISRQEQLFRLPSLGGGLRARSVKVLSSAYPMIVDEDAGTARYQIQCELIYTQEV